MKSRHIVSGVMLTTLGTVLVAGCGGGGSSVIVGSSSGYANHALVSDGAVAADHIDKNLVNPWGLAFEASGPAWVANNGSQTSTLYDGTGAVQSLVVSIPAGKNGAANPTGTVFNSSSDFVIMQGGLSAPAQFLFDGEGGTITGWVPSLGNAAIIAYDDATGGAVYKGLALASAGGANFLYAADFHNAKVDVFDTHFAKVATHGNFADPNLPAGYAPFGIQNVQGNLVVTFAQQMGPANHDEMDGAGLGVVDLFDTAGNLMRRISAGGTLNAPWGVALAPANFGVLSNMLLIGNFGDGRINAFNMANGQFAGTLSTPAGAAIAVDGLWSISFGNGFDNQPTNTLFYTAGINHEADGLYGRIDATGSSTGAGMGGAY